MQRLGRVLHISRSRNVIVKVEEVPKIGAHVVDKKLRSIGEVVDVFGPVSSPYASVKPEIQEMERLSGSMLYVRPKRKGKIKK
ncbi:MAG: H/ACA ribonucleoprotein complex subunit GAR1 [Thermoproteota archaeon]